jgi:molybdate transport system substrate-binding protein
MDAALSVISSMATRLALAELAEDHRRATGQRIVVLSVGGVDAVRRVRQGESFDVVVLAADALARLADDGYIDAGSVRQFARSPAAVAVRAGAPRPSTCDETSIRELVTDARAIALSTGPSGVAVRALLQHWGVREPDTRIVEAPPGMPVARLLAGGQADLGFQQRSELLGEPGIDIVGDVPSTLVPMTTFAVGLGRGTSNPAPARALVEAITSTAADQIKHRHGLQPAA